MSKRFFLMVIWWASLSFSDGFKQIVQPIISQVQQLAGLYIQDRSGAIPVLAIAGCSAVGKSYFSRLVARTLRELGFNIFVLHQDDYLNHNHTFAGYKIHPNLDHEALHCFLAQNRKGIKKISKPCLTDKKKLTNKLIDLSRVDLIIFEGIYALTGLETYDFVQYCSAAIFLDSSTANIVKWHALRNKQRPFFQRHTDSEIKQHASCLLYEYVRYILPSKKNAQFIIYKDDLNSFRLII